MCAWLASMLHSTSTSVALQTGCAKRVLKDSTCAEDSCCATCSIHTVLCTRINSNCSTAVSVRLLPSHTPTDAHRHLMHFSICSNIVLSRSSTWSPVPGPLASACQHAFRCFRYASVSPPSHKAVVRQASTVLDMLSLLRCIGTASSLFLRFACYRNLAVGWSTASMNASYRQLMLHVRHSYRKVASILLRFVVAV